MKIIDQRNYGAPLGLVRAIQVFDRDPGDSFAAELTWPDGRPFIRGDYLTDGREVEMAARSFIADLARLLGARVQVFFDGTRGGCSIPEWDATVKDPPRHEEEMRWIARACKAEALVAELSIKVGKQQDEIERYKKLYAREERADAAWKWSREVGKFLKEVLTGGPAGSVDIAWASRLFTDAIALGIIPEPDCKPGVGLGRPGDGCPCPPEEPFPGQIIESICPKCGGRKI